MSIQRKLMLIVILASTVPVLLTCGVLIGHEFLSVRANMANEFASLADVTASNITAGIVFHDRHSIERTVAGLNAERHVLAACVYGREGQLLSVYRNPAHGSDCPQTAAGSSIVFGRDRLLVVRPIVFEGERIGAIAIESDLQRISSRLRAYAGIIALVLVGALLVTLAVSVRFERVISNPIVELASVARQVSEREDYSVRAIKRADDEFGALVDAFNDMLDQIACHADHLTTVNRELSNSREAAEDAASALAESEKRFRATFDGAPIGMMLADLEGHILEGNHSLRQMLGFSREEFLSMTFADFTHPEDVALSRRHFRELTSGECDRYHLDKRYCSKDGRTIWVRLTISRLKSGRGEFIIGMVEDVTERKQLEEQFRQAQKMEAIGRLAGGVAHDFNNLLTVIKGNTELLIKRLSTESPMHRNLGQIRKASDRASSLVDQLLAFSRKQLIAPKVLDLNVVVHDLEKMLRRLIGEDVELVASVVSAPVWVNAGPVQLEQVLLNLAVNARDAMPEGGRLTIRSASVRVDEMTSGKIEVRPGSYAVLAVEDTGIGMTEETRSHIFEPFYTTKEVGKGTGLGLSTVYGIVQQSGAHIQVDSHPGQGSKFTIYFPCAEGAMRDAGSEEPSAVPPSRGHETILLVEDEELVRAMLSEVLTDQGYKVLEARQGWQALELAAQHDGPIQLLLTDIVMPRMNGQELVERIAPLRPEMKVLYMSGYTDKAISLEAPLLRKPFTPDDLARRVRAILDEARLAESEPAMISGSPALI